MIEIKRPTLNLSETASHILKDRYLKKDSRGNIIESHEELFYRVSSAVSSCENPSNKKYWNNAFYDLMVSLKFLPNSPTLVNAGKNKGCLSACFVVSPEDEMSSIMQVAHHAALIEKWGGGIGFGFSKLRPKGSAISSTHGKACGPVAVMKLYSAVGSMITQGAFRLGAHMGQLRDSHPDILEFIRSKDDDISLQNFNISVQLTDAFMNAVNNDDNWNLIAPHNKQKVKTIKARELWNAIIESAWKTGDPGVVFIDRIWETAPNPQLGKIESSNPCGEEFLENYGNCSLGSISLEKHLNQDNSDFDWDELENTVKTAVRFLDNVIEINHFPLQELKDINLATRRIGLGVMGWADALVFLNIPYDSKKSLDLANKVGYFIKRVAWEESRNLATERGPFPEYSNSELKKRGFPPVRNSSVITIAPTGTISRIAGCSSGIEPHFAIAWKSNILWKTQTEASIQVIDAPTSIKNKITSQLGDAVLATEILESVSNAKNESEVNGILIKYNINPDVFSTSMSISPESHINMQAAWQNHVTNSVSKTINMPNKSTIEDVSKAYMQAWETKCKSITVYRDGSKSQQVLETHTENKEQPIIHNHTPRKRPATLPSVTEKVRTGHGNMYITVTFDQNKRPFEVFACLGKAGGCDSANIEAISRMISISLRSGVEVEEIISNLKGINCCPVWHEGTLVRSIPDAISYVLAKHTTNTTNTKYAHQIDTPPISNQYEMVNANNCSKCQGKLAYIEGCSICTSCGYSKCD